MQGGWWIAMVDGNGCNIGSCVSVDKKEYDVALGRIMVVGRWLVLRWDDGGVGGGGSDGGVGDRGGETVAVGGDGGGGDCSSCCTNESTRGRQLVSVTVVKVMVVATTAISLLVMYTINI